MYGYDAHILETIIIWLPVGIWGVFPCQLGTKKWAKPKMAKH